MPLRRSATKTPAEARDAIGLAFKSFAENRSGNANEATTRVELIDEVLRAVGWPTGSIERERPTGTGDFIDYELNADGPWMVVEAKRVGESFRLSQKSGRAQHPSRSVQSLISTGGESLREVLKQAARYCNERGIALACATNGVEWIFFRGLSTPTRAWTKGHAIVFSGLDDITARFDEFWACASRASAGTTFLHERLELPPTGMLPPARVPADVLTFARTDRDPASAALVRNISDFLFSEIFGEQRSDMLDRCYVEPGTSEEFARSIHRLLKDSEGVIKDEGIEAIPTDAQSFVAHVDRQEATGAKQPVVVVGNVGVGKTTFLQRSLAQLRSDRSAICAVIDLEGFGQGGGIDGAAEQAQVATEILKKLETATLTVLKHRSDISDAARLQAEHSSRETLSTLQLNNIKSAKRLGEALWKADHTAWLRKEMELFDQLTSQPVQHLVAYVRHLHGRFSRKDGGRYPILIALDNLDLGTDEYQRAIYGLAQRLTRDTNATVVVCLREDTFRLGREPGGFLTSSAFPFVFHIARPALDQLLRKRVAYGEYAEEKRTLPQGLKTEGERILEVCKLVRTTLLAQKSESLELFAGLGGHNMRATLDLVRALVDGSVKVLATPDASATYAFECLLNSPGYETLQARVVNCFDAEPASAPAHGLQTRLLAYYSFALDAGPERVLFEEVDCAVANFAAWGYPVALVRWSLERLVKNGLLRDPRGGRHPNQQLPKRLSIAASGHVHLNRLVDLRAYRAAVASSTRWYDSQLADSFVRIASAAGGSSGLTIGDVIESKAIDVFDAYIAQSLTREDGALTTALAPQRWRAEVLSRSARILPPQYQPVPPPMPAPSESLAPLPQRTKAKKDQLRLKLGVESDTPTLKKIHRDVEHKGTVWTPRILWALEFAKRRHLGPQRASDLAELLVRYGDIDVPRNNVARAFRDFRPEHGVDGLWTSEKKRYAITEAGALLLEALLSDDGE